MAVKIQLVRNRFDVDVKQHLYIIIISELVRNK